MRPPRSMPRRFWGFVGYRLSPLEERSCHRSARGHAWNRSHRLRRAVVTENPQGVDDVGNGVVASSTTAAQRMASAAALPPTKATQADPIDGSRWGDRAPRLARQGLEGPGLEVQVTTANGGFSESATPACLH